MITPAITEFALHVTLVALLLCSSGQIQHGYLRTMHSNPRIRPFVKLYEGALLAHILVMALNNISSIRYGITDPVPFTTGLVPDAKLLIWLNFAFAAVTAYAALTDMSDSGVPESTRWMPPSETVLIFFCTPPALELLGQARVVVFVIDAAYFLVRTIVLIRIDSKNSRQIVSPLSLTEALKHLPEGVLYLDEDGRDLLANDVMRRCLAALDIPSSSMKSSELWSLLEEKEGGEHGVYVPDEFKKKPGTWVILRIGPDEVRLFSFDVAKLENVASDHPKSPGDSETPLEKTVHDGLGFTPYTRVIAYDVSEEVKVLEQIEQTNASLESVQAELRTSLENVCEAAESEAMLRMRGRVHDVIGQRLSMLHRSLEDNDISNERIAQLRPLLTSILEDLSADIHTSPSDELIATIDAFALTGVRINVQGELPADEQRAKIFADAIREATTNAVKHTGAQRVDVQMSQSSLEITNDGLSAEGPIVEGMGLSTIRQTVENAGGTLAITADPFVLHIEME